MKQLVLISALALLSFVGSGNSLIYGATVSKAPSSASHGRVSDAELDRTIRAKLAKSKIGKDGLKFQVKGGVVTWEGNTNVMQHKGAATRMARTAGAVASGEQY